MYYRGFSIVTEGERVSIIDPRYGSVVMIKPDETEAKRFIRAYRDGTTWAVIEALNFSRQEA